MPLTVRPNSAAQLLVGFKRPRGGQCPSYSTDFPTAAPPSKKVKGNEIENQTAETIEILDKKERDWLELHAQLEDYRHDELLINIVE